MPYLLPLEPRPPRSLVPLTAVQKRYWNEIVRMGASVSPFRMAAAFLRLSGALSLSRLEESLEAVVTRHESLRTRIACIDRESQQIVDAPFRPEVQKVDLSRLASADRNEAARRLANEFVAEQINPTVDPVFAARLLKFSEMEHVLFLGVDHIVSDALSASFLTHEVLASLKTEAQQSPNLVSEGRIQFPDYALWEHRTNETWWRENGPYWKGRFLNVKKIAIQTDRNSETDGPITPRLMYAPFGRGLTDALRELARRERCLPPLVIMSLYLAVMSRWCGRNDLLVKFLSHGRHGRPEFKNMIGCLAHSVFLRIELVPREQLRDLLRRVTEELQAALTHDPARVTATNLISEDSTELCFNWLPPGWGPSGVYPVEDSEADLKITRFPVSREIPTKFMANFMDTPSGLLLALMYDGDQFSNRSIQRFTDEVRGFAKDLVGRPDATLDSLSCCG